MESYITDESSESVRFTIDARVAAEDIGQLLSDGSLTVVNDEDEWQVFEIAAKLMQTVRQNRYL